MDSDFRWGDLLAATLFLAAGGGPLPSDLATVGADQIHPHCASSEHPRIIRALWGACRPSFSIGDSADCLVRPHGFLTKDALVSAVRRHSRQFQRHGRLEFRTPDKLHAPAGFSRLGPSQKIKMLKSNRVMPRQLNGFIANGTQANFLTQVRGSLPGLASAFRCYSPFCELIAKPDAPPTEELIIRWSSMFNDTATFENYIFLLQKACFSLRWPTA